MTDNPFLIETELPREAGNSRRVERTVTLPDRLGTAVIAIPAGGQVHLDLLLESVLEGVLVSGTATGVLEGECVRCLAPLSQDFQVHVTELFSYPESLAEHGEVDADGEPVPVVDEDTVDVSEVVVDAVVGDLPFNPVCREDCPGLCPECGINLSDHPEHEHEAPIDPRWSALSELASDDDA